MDATRTPGQRRPDGTQSHELAPGEYALDLSGQWICRPPWKHAGGSLARHSVVEHEDGTITAAPSILIAIPPIGSWHGYLERGVWREC
jgi:hypothetical protein